MTDGRDTTDRSTSNAAAPVSNPVARERRLPYEPPRVERRIPVAANTMQGTSGGPTFFGDE